MKKFKLLISLTLVLTLLISVIAVAPINVGAVANTWDPDHGVYDISTEEDLIAFRNALAEDNLQDAVKYYYFYGKTINLLNNINPYTGLELFL